MKEVNDTVGLSFPRAPKVCKGLADKYFACLLEKGEKKNTDDMKAGERAITACKRLQSPYDACLSKLETQKPKSLYRVSVQSVTNPLFTVYILLNLSLISMINNLFDLLL
jgi:hypothetical protein